MPFTLTQYREKYPQYNGIPDEKLALGIYRKYASNEEPDTFLSKLGAEHVRESFLTSLGSDAPGLSSEEKNKLAEQSLESKKSSEQLKPNLRLEDAKEQLYQENQRNSPFKTIAEAQENLGKGKFDVTDEQLRTANQAKVDSLIPSSTVDSQVKDFSQPNKWEQNRFAALTGDPDLFWERAKGLMPEDKLDREYKARVIMKQTMLEDKRINNIKNQERASEASNDASIFDSFVSGNLAGVLPYAYTGINSVSDANYRKTIYDLVAEQPELNTSQDSTLGKVAYTVGATAPTLVEQAGSAIAGSVIGGIPGAIVSAVGNIHGTIMMGVDSYKRIQTSLLKQGVSEQDANYAAALGASGIIATEFASGGGSKYALKVPNGKRFFDNFLSKSFDTTKKISKTIFKENFLEEFPQQAIEWTASNTWPKNKDGSVDWNSVGETAWDTFVSTTILAGGMDGAGKIIEAKHLYDATSQTMRKIKDYFPTATKAQVQRGVEATWKGASVLELADVMFLEDEIIAPTNATEETVKQVDEINQTNKDNVTRIKTTLLQDALEQLKKSKNPSVKSETADIATETQKIKRHDVVLTKIADVTGSANYLNTYGLTSDESNLVKNLSSDERALLYALGNGLQGKSLLTYLNFNKQSAARTSLEKLGLLEKSSAKTIEEFIPASDLAESLKSGKKVLGFANLNLSPLGLKLADNLYASDEIYSVSNKKFLDRNALREINNVLNSEKDLNAQKLFDILFSREFISNDEYNLLSQMSQSKEMNNYVSNSRVSLIEQSLYNPNTLGSYQQILGENGVVSIFNGSNVFTILHELGHVGAAKFLDPKNFKELVNLYYDSSDYKLYLKSTSDTDQLKYRYSFEEWYARSFADYLMNKHATPVTLAKIFKTNISNLKTIWNLFKKSDRLDSSKIKMYDLFDSMFSSESNKLTHEMEINIYEATNLVSDQANLFTSDAIQSNIDLILEKKYPSIMSPPVVGSPKNSISSQTIDMENDKDNNISTGAPTQQDIDTGLSKIVSTTKQTDAKKLRDRRILLRDAHKIQKQLSLSKDQAIALKEQLTGKPSMSTFTDEELKQYLSDLKYLEGLLNDPRFVMNNYANKLGLTSDTLSSMVNVSRNNFSTVAEVLNRRDDKGGYSDNKELRQREINRDTRLIESINARKRLDTDRIDKQKKVKNLTETFSSMRYVADALERATGLPFYKVIDDLENGGVKADYDAFKYFMDILRKPGKRTGKAITRLLLAQEEVQSPNINKALFEKDATKRAEYLSKLTPIQLDVYDKMQEILQGEAANAIREVRWWRWNKAVTLAELTENKIKKKEYQKEARRLKPKDISDKEEAKILSEGREAYAKGKLSEWIKTQKFGTREQYFISASENVGLRDSILSPVEFDSELGGTQGVQQNIMRAANTRNGVAEAIHTPVLQAVMYHLRRAMITNAIKDDYTKLNQIIKDGDLTSTDTDRIQRWIDNLVGKPEDAGWATRFSEKLNNAFWKMFAFQVKRAGHYFVRNLLQFITIQGHIGKAELMRSGSLLAAGRMNPLLKDELNTRWYGITQKKAIQDEVMILNEASKNRELGVVGTARAYGSYVTDFGNAILTESDEVTRKPAFMIFHESAYHNANQFLKGERSYGSLRSNLYLDNLSDSQIDNLEQMIQNKDLKNFCYNYAKYKVENIFMKYNRTGRSLSEQTRAGRLITGLITYPRGMVEQLVQNSLKPTIRGLKDGDIRTVYTGVMTSVGLYVSIRLMNELSKAIMGNREKEDYTLAETFLGYTPGSIGYRKMMDIFDEISSNSGRAIEEDGYSDKSISKIMKSVAADTLDWWIPFADLNVTLYENLNDKAGMNFWSVLSKELGLKYQQQHGRKYYYDRNLLESMQHTLFGGEEFKSNKKAFNNMDTTEQTLRVLTGYEASYQRD